VLQEEEEAEEGVEPHRRILFLQGLLYSIVVVPATGDAAAGVPVGAPRIVVVTLVVTVMDTSTTGSHVNNLYY
jgi:hypothetical protein